MRAPKKIAATPRSSLCLISARNLGDAVIHARFLRALATEGFAREYVVWTFPQARFLFENIPHCTVVTSDFPIGASLKSFFRGGFLGFGRTWLRILRRRPEAVLELVSDGRERIISALVLARQRLYLHWTSDHPFRLYNHMPKWRGTPFLDVPSSSPGLYGTYNSAFQRLTQSDRTVFSAPSPRHTKQRLVVALHPFASRSLKLWPWERWSQLISILAEQPIDLVLFGAPSDGSMIESLVHQHPGRIEVFTRSLPEFADRLSQVDLLIGLDSFSIHLANDAGVPTIMLNGPNDPRVFTPIGTHLVNRAGSCPHQPCHGRAVCEGTDYQYICMSAITVDDVLDQVRPLLGLLA